MLCCDLRAHHQYPSSCCIFRLYPRNPDRGPLHVVSSFRTCYDEPNSGRLLKCMNRLKVAKFKGLTAIDLRLYFLVVFNLQFAQLPPVLIRTLNGLNYHVQHATTIQTVLGITSSKPTTLCLRKALIEYRLMFQYRNVAGYNHFPRIAKAIDNFAVRTESYPQQLLDVSLGG